MLNCIVVGAGGALGAMCRYLIGLLPVEPQSGFPVKTFCINIIGSFVIGLVVALSAKNAVSPRLVLFLKVGICGGFTTFSSFALETDQLLARGKGGVALAYALLSMAVGVLAVFAAEKLVS